MLLISSQSSFSPACTLPLLSQTPSLHRSQSEEECGQICRIYALLTPTRIWLSHFSPLVIPAYSPWWPTHTFPNSFFGKIKDSIILVYKLYSYDKKQVNLCDVRGYLFNLQIFIIPISWYPNILNSNILTCKIPSSWNPGLWADQPGSGHLEPGRSCLRSPHWLLPLRWRHWSGWSCWSASWWWWRLTSTPCPRWRLLITCDSQFLNQETLRNIASATLDFPAELFEVVFSLIDSQQVCVCVCAFVRVFLHCNLSGTNN